MEINSIGNATKNNICFSRYFKIHDNYTFIKNKSIEQRIVKNIVELDRGLHHKCFIWKKNNHYIKLASQKVQIRRLIYDYCIGNSNTSLVKQRCNNDKICINPEH